MAKLTHTDESGRAHMVDTGNKPVQQRIATASGMISLKPETLRLIRENLMKKGDVLTVAEIAGIQAAKKCSELIPLCHNIVLDQVRVTLTTDETGSHRCKYRALDRPHRRGNGGADGCQRGASYCVRHVQSC